MAATKKAAKKPAAKKPAAKKPAAKKAPAKKAPAKKAAPKARVSSSQAAFQVYQDASGGWRWRLVHKNTNTIADSSEAYSSRAGALDGIASVKANVPGAAVTG